VSSTAGTLAGSVNPRGTSTVWWFEYGPTTAYGSRTPEVSAGNGRVDVTATVRLTGLAPGATTHYVLRARNSVGQTGAGADRAFQTTLSAPSVGV
jgi:hypothetical protein